MGLNVHHKPEWEVEKQIWKLKQLNGSFESICGYTFCLHLNLLFQGYYDNPKICALYVMKGTLEGES